jgi:hypothetical protein
MFIFSFTEGAKGCRLVVCLLDPSSSCAPRVTIWLSYCHMQYAELTRMQSSFF